MLIDTHCHLDAAEFAADRDAVAAAALAAGVSRIVVPAVDATNFAAVAAVCREYPACHAAYGIHPLYVDKAKVEDLETLRRVLAKAHAVAIGEIGLDYFVPGHDKQAQEFFFVEQLKLARELNLPVILHIRRAIDDVLKHLRRIPVPGGIVHAFNGSRQQADEFIRLGFKLGFGGAMTFARALRIRELATNLPLEAIVLETDAPDIPPQWLEHGRNEPAELPRIAAVLAELRGISIEDLACASTANAIGALPALGQLH